MMSERVSERASKRASKCERNNKVISKGTPRQNSAAGIKQFPSIVRTCLSLTQGCVNAFDTAVHRNAGMGHGLRWPLRVELETTCKVALSGRRLDKTPRALPGR